MAIPVPDANWGVDSTDVHQWSFYVDITTGAAIAPGAPTSVTGVAGNGQVTLSWVAPASNGGANITNYIVTNYIAGVAQTTAQYGAVLTGVFPVTGSAGTTPLTNGTAYTFTVAAVNSAGTGAQSTASAAITPIGTVPDPPSNVTAVAGSASAQVTWVAPTNNGGASITGYTVTPYIGVTAQTPTTVGNVLTTNITSLTNGTAYTFTVKATNSVGTSTESVASTAVTPVAAITVPGAPTSVMGAPGNTTVVVDWTAPSSGGSPITGYVVTPFIGVTAQATTTVSNVLTATITGLTNGTAYTFKVAAINVIGTGAQSAPSGSVTPVGGGGVTPSRVTASNQWYPTLTNSHTDAMQFVVTAPISGALLYSSPIFVNSGSTSPSYLPGTAPAAGQPRPSVIEGSVTFSKSATVRSTMRMKIVDDTGLLIPPNTGGILTPWGNEISVYRGLVYPDGSVEMPLLGIFRMTDIVTEDAQGAPTITITGSDRSRIISRDKVINFYQSGVSEAYTDIIRDMALLTYPSVTFNGTAADWRNVPPAGIGANGGIVGTDALVPLIFQEGTDLWTEMKHLANSLACDLYFDRHGVLTLVLDPNMNYTLASLPTIPASVATFIEGPQARFIRAQRTLSDKDAYNQWVITGEGQVIGASLNPIRSTPAQDTDPSSPTNIAGPYGVVNNFETNTLMRTQAQVNLFAQYKLRISAGAQEQVAFDGFSDSYLNVDDAITVIRSRLGIPNNSYIIDTIVHSLTVKDPMQVTLRERRSLA